MRIRVSSRSQASFDDVVARDRLLGFLANSGEGPRNTTQGLVSFPFAVAARDVPSFRATLPSGLHRFTLRALINFQGSTRHGLGDLTPDVQPCRVLHRFDSGYAPSSPLPLSGSNSPTDAASGHCPPIFSGELPSPAWRSKQRRTRRGRLVPPKSGGISRGILLHEIPVRYRKRPSICPASPRSITLKISCAQLVLYQLPVTACRATSAAARIRRRAQTRSRGPHSEHEDW